MKENLRITKNPAKKKSRNSSLISTQIACVDLFCGVGGLTHGLIKGGIRVIAGVDIDPQCRFPYEANNEATFIEKDISQLTSQELVNTFGDTKIRLLAGCAPCQPFSTYSRKGRQLREDKKWGSVADFGRLVQETQPELVTMENVPQLLTHQVFQAFLQDLQGYEVCCQVVECVAYGVPQTRKRLVLIASRIGAISLPLPDPFGHVNATVHQAISHLPKIAAGSFDPNDPLHTAPALSELNLRRIRASKPGGTWRDWDESLLAECHRKKSGETYPSVYGRMEWYAPSPTITTQCFGFGNGRFGHPEQDRAISLREAAILQTFPEDYCFLASGESVRFNKLGRLIGNAVPVRIGEVISQSILTHLPELC